VTARRDDASGKAPDIDQCKNGNTAVPQTEAADCFMIQLYDRIIGAGSAKWKWEICVGTIRNIDSENLSGR
jgi:hypothetical protein